MTKSVYYSADGRSMLDRTRTTAFSGVGSDFQGGRYLCPRWHVKATFNTLGALAVGIVEVEDILKHDVERDVCRISTSVLRIAIPCCHLALLLAAFWSAAFVGGLVRWCVAQPTATHSGMRANKCSLHLSPSHRVFVDQHILYAGICCCCGVTSLSDLKIHVQTTHDIQTNVV